MVCTVPHRHIYILHLLAHLEKYHHEQGSNEARTVAAEYTFFLAIPVMFGASILKLFKFGFHFTGAEAFILILGMVVAFVVSLFVIKFLMGCYYSHFF